MHLPQAIDLHSVCFARNFMKRALAQDMPKHVAKMISLPAEVVAMGKERARQFRIPFSQHVARLIREDYESGKQTIMIVAEASPRYRKFLAQQRKDKGGVKGSGQNLPEEHDQ